MNRKRSIVLLTSISLILSLTIFASSKPQISVNEILEKNVQAVGGKDKINSIENFSFQDGQTTYYLSSVGRMKLTSGRDPVITEIILVNQDSALRNCFNKLSDFGPLLEQTLQIRAKLYTGLFTLMNFKGELEFSGTKKFGPKEFHVLTNETEDLEVEFYIDSKDFLLKRVVFRGHNPDFGKYEVNHDIGPYQEVDGINLPSSWFRSQVGTRGSTAEISDVKWNLDLTEDFFSNHEVNVGKTDFSEGILKGNIVDFEIGRGGQVMIATNWTDDCIRRAGFAPEDKLILTLGEAQMEVDFFASQPPRSAYREGAILIMPARGDENYVITILDSGYQDLVEQLEPLMAIQLKEKD